MFMIGLDLGKRKSQLCVQDSEGTLLAELRVDTKREDLLAAVAPYSAARVLIEASTSSEWVARTLEAAGLEVVIGDPRFSLMYAQTNKKVKTDRRDARALADALRLKAFRPAYRKTDAARRLQGRLVIRKQLVGMRTRLINLVRAMCEREGVIIPRCRAETFAEALHGTQMDEALFEMIGPAVDQYASLTQQIEAADLELETLAKSHPVAKLLQTARGVGPLTSLAFVAAIDDVKRFSSARELTAYLGLVPSENSSGDARSKPGAITKSGNSLLRSYLFEAALTLTKRTAPEAPLKSWYLKLTARSNGQGSKKRSVVAVARRLARILFAMWRDGKPFDSARTAPQPFARTATTGTRAA